MTESNNIFFIIKIEFSYVSNMGSDEAKIEKKRIKAQVKAEKTRAKLPSEPSSSPDKTPWYKDPTWVRAIIAIGSLVIMVITLYFTII